MYLNYQMSILKLTADWTEIALSVSLVPIMPSYQI